MTDTDEKNFDDDFRTAAEANARKAAELEEKLLAKIEGKLDTMDAKEASTALQAVANMKTRNVEKLRSMSAPAPTGLTPLEELMAMAKKGYIKFTGDAAMLADEEDPSTT